MPRAHDASPPAAGAEATAPPAAGGRAAALLSTMRPHQWLKNGFVLTGLLFGHAWDDPLMVQRALLTMVAFCLAASATYAVNDVLDRALDAEHPARSRRPVAAGRISPRAALLLALLLVTSALLVGAAVTPTVVVILLAYLALTLAYSLRLKTIVILDVFLLATGFMLRIMGGTLGIGIPPSRWLVLCGLMLSLFLGFSKRRAELAWAGGGERRGGHRAVLRHYSPILLDQMMVVTASASVMGYALYSVSPETQRLHGTANLIYTLPIVIYGIFRYMYLLHNAGRGSDAASDLLTDRPLAAAVVAWIAAVLLLTA